MRARELPAEKTSPCETSLLVGGRPPIGSWRKQGMKKLSHEEFVRLAIVRLRNGNFKGIHSVYSGFNEAFRKYYEGDDPVQVTNGFSQQGKLVIRPVKSGVMLYLPEDAPQGDRGDQALRKMGLME